ncbi:MAG TPA: cupredoxin domain-containing protein [Solirubrobacteraceae bacterium]|nr:cupredoxin domain-containing protein [Solirubrobacteraceae bacterium]
MTRTTWLAVPVLAVALGVAGCGGSSNDNSGSSGSSGASTPSSSSGSGGGSSIALAADPSGKLAFDKKTLTAKAGTVTIDFTNDSSTPHAVEVEGHGVEKETKVITQGKAAVTAKLKPGKYEFYCPVDGHRMAGMQGTLTVN